MIDRKGYGLVEFMVASVIVIVLIAATLGVYVVAKTVIQNGIIENNLQRDANVVLDKIVRGLKEGGAIVGLRSASSYSLPAADPAGSAIDFVGPDGNTRKFFVSGNSIIYQSPLQTPNQKTIYTKPAGSTMTLLFWEPSGYVDHATVGVYCAISSPTSGKTLSGSLATYVTIKNIPK